MEKVMKLVTIVINGEPEAGKDTFVDYCIQRMEIFHQKGVKCSSVDRVKEAAILLGWDEVKDDKGRSFLSLLKDYSTAFYEGPMKYMNNIVHSSDAEVLFVFIREPEEIAKFVKCYPDSLTVEIRSNRSKKHTNTGDSRTHAYPYSHRVYNNGSKDMLQASAWDFVNHLRGAYIPNNKEEKEKYHANIDEALS